MPVMLPACAPPTSAAINMPLCVPAFAGDAARWRAVQTRDEAADGVFVYAVRTTRIYCRPNCKARLARRANVAFYSGPPAAEAAGFRACKRCRPRVAGPTPADAAVARVRAVLAGMEGDGEGEGETAHETVVPSRPPAAALAAQARVSRWHFHRTFKQVTGLTPAAYLQQQRARRACGRPASVPASDSAHGEEEAFLRSGGTAPEPDTDTDWCALPLFGDQGLAAMQQLAREMAVQGAWDADDEAWLGGWPPDGQQG